MKFLRGLLCLIFVDLALDPLKKRIEEIADRLAGILSLHAQWHKGLPSVKDMYLHERDNCTAFRWGMHRHLRRLMKGLAVSKACRKEELPHSVFIETK